MSEGCAVAIGGLDGSDTVIAIVGQVDVTDDRAFRILDDVSGGISRCTAVGINGRSDGEEGDQIHWTSWTLWTSMRWTRNTSWTC